MVMDQTLGSNLLLAWNIGWMCSIVEVERLTNKMRSHISVAVYFGIMVMLSHIRPSDIRAHVPT